MKKHKRITIILLLLILAFCFVGCGDINLDDNVIDGTDIEISTPNYGFVASEDFTPNEADPLEGTFKYFEGDKTFEVGTTYYLIVTFTVTSRRENSGQTYFKTTAKFDNLDVLNATMQQASTSSTSVEIEHDMEEDKLTRNVQASFRISEIPSDVKRYTMIVRMVPNKVSDELGVEIKIDFSLDANSNYKIWGAKDGFQQRITIDKGKLGTPSLSYNYSNMHLEWQHVKNASYYVIYDNDVPVLFKQGGVTTNKIVVTNDIRTGDKMQIDLTTANIQDGYKIFTIKAFGENGTEDERFYSSNLSNAVELDW